MTLRMERRKVEQGEERRGGKGQWRQEGAKRRVMDGETIEVEAGEK